jgi:hypothetical protein
MYENCQLFKDILEDDTDFDMYEDIWITQYSRF